MNITTPEEFESLVRSVLVNKANADDRREQATKLAIDMLSELGYERGAALADEMIRATKTTKKAPPPPPPSPEPEKMGSGMPRKFPTRDEQLTGAEMDGYASGLYERDKGKCPHRDGQYRRAWLKFYDKGLEDRYDGETFMINIKTGKKTMIPKRSPPLPPPAPPPDVQRRGWP